MVEHETSSCRRRLLFSCWILLHLGCLGYSLYIIWLLAYLKDNLHYWFLGLIPFIFNLLFPMLTIFKNRGIFRDNISGSFADDTAVSNAEEINFFKLSRLYLHEAASASVNLILVSSFTMLTRLAYYHRQPDEFIGPRFIIMSLQGSAILFFLDFCLQREGKLKSLLDSKDTLDRMLLDFVDIFNMVEILSANQCVGVGSLVAENSHTERSIQAFCTISFAIVQFGLNASYRYSFLRRSEYLANQSQSNDDNSGKQHDPRRSEERSFSLLTMFSGFYQNIPFLVIRIVVWARYNLYSLAYLVKNVIVVVIAIALYVKEAKIADINT